MIYIVMSQTVAWGAGKTKQEAIAEASQWLCDENGVQGITVEQVEKMLISEHESRNGADGVFIGEVEAEWSDEIEQMDGDQLAVMYIDSQDEE
ncbi:hypothetical protein ABMA58_00095 [Oceanospirillum sp. HFRX-1_2]